jgi:hypothetical protein
MMNEEIHQAFLNTTFRIFSVPVIDIKINKITPELNHLNYWAFLTAWNPLPEILSEAENKRRNLELEEDFKALDLIYHQGIGISEDGNWQEDSFFIENCSEEKANELAEKYGQLAFVWGGKNKDASLIYTQKK